MPPRYQAEFWEVMGTERGSFGRSSRSRFIADGDEHAQQVAEEIARGKSGSTGRDTYRQKGRFNVKTVTVQSVKKVSK